MAHSGDCNAGYIEVPKNLEDADLEHDAQSDVNPAPMDWLFIDTKFFRDMHDCGVGAFYAKRVRLSHAGAINTDISTEIQMAILTLLVAVLLPFLSIRYSLLMLTDIGLPRRLDQTKTIFKVILVSVSMCMPLLHVLLYDCLEGEPQKDSFTHRSLILFFALYLLANQVLGTYLTAVASAIATEYKRNELHSLSPISTTAMNESCKGLASELVEQTFGFDCGRYCQHLVGQLFEASTSKVSQLSQRKSEMNNLDQLPNWSEGQDAFVTSFQHSGSTNFCQAVVWTLPFASLWALMLVGFGDQAGNNGHVVVWSSHIPVCVLATFVSSLSALNVLGGLRNLHRMTLMVAYLAATWNARCSLLSRYRFSHPTFVDDSDWAVRKYGKFFRSVRLDTVKIQSSEQLLAQIKCKFKEQDHFEHQDGLPETLSALKLKTTILWLSCQASFESFKLRRCMMAVATYALMSSVIGAYLVHGRCYWLAAAALLTTLFKFAIFSKIFALSVETTDVRGKEMQTILFAWRQHIDAIHGLVQQANGWAISADSIVVSSYFRELKDSVCFLAEKLHCEVALTALFDIPLTREVLAKIIMSGGALFIGAFSKLLVSAAKASAGHVFHLHW